MNKPRAIASVTDVPERDLSHLSPHAKTDEGDRLTPERTASTGYYAAHNGIEGELLSEGLLPLGQRIDHD